MMGSAATSMSTMFNAMVDITPPNLVLNDMLDGKDVIHDFLPLEEPLVRISFRMVVEDVIDSTLVQVIPVSVAKGMVDKLMGAMGGAVPRLQPQSLLPLLNRHQLLHRLLMIIFRHLHRQSIKLPSMIRHHIRHLMIIPPMGWVVSLMVSIVTNREFRRLFNPLNLHRFSQVRPCPTLII